MQLWADSKDPLWIMWIHMKRLEFLPSLAVGIFWLDGWVMVWILWLDREVRVLAFTILQLLLASNLLFLFIRRKFLIKNCSRGLCRMAVLLSASSYVPGHRLMTPYVGHSWRYGVLQKLMIGRQNSSHHVNPSSRGWHCRKVRHQKHKILWQHYMDLIKLGAWLSWWARLAPIEPIKEWLGLRGHHLSSQLRSIIYPI